MILDRSRIIPQIWVLTVLFYLLRTIAEPLKYLFILSFVVLILGYSYFSIKKFKRKSIGRFFSATKEFQILGLFLILGIILSTQVEILSLKSLINFLGITVLYLIYFEYRQHIQLIRLFKGWIILTLIIALLGLLKWFNLILNLNIGWFSGFYEYGISLVSEYNFYACYFIISIVIFFYALYKELVQTKLIANQAILLLFIANVVFSGSRRGLIVLVILLLIAVPVLLTRKTKRVLFHRNLFCLNILLFSLLLLIVALVPFRSKIIKEKSTKAKIAISVNRYSTIFNPNITYNLLFSKLWPESDVYEEDKTNWETYATYNNRVNGNVKAEYRDLRNEYWLNFKKTINEDNLIYNGNFENGLEFWGKSAPDTIKHEIINTKYGNAVRVSRFEGLGYWSLEYFGREIIYHAGVTYTFKFKYRVVDGSGVPFAIGWWINEGEGYKNVLPHNIKRLDNEWFEYTASYKFRNTQSNLQTFMNSQKANTVVDFTHIELTNDDTLNRSNFSDQARHLEGANLFYNSNFEHGSKYWAYVTPDPINHELIETQFGRAIRVTRKEGDGYWPLVYQGRDIFYYKNLTYHFRFKYRVIEGGGTPFNIGWWIEGEKQKPYNLHKEIFPINDDWFECTASYKFENDHYEKAQTFMNSQQSNTIIDFTDIELICNDTLNRSMYADENIDKIRMLEEARINQQLNSGTGKLLSERINRWKYSLDLWTTEYKWSEKIFGGGFDYLDKFGQNFYPDKNKIDYPHNPIISAFLYSGLIGGFFYIYFLALSFWYYWKYRKQHVLFFILFLITFVFVFISSDSHFNVPIFAMLSLVPFITKFIVKEKEQKNPS